MFNNKHTKLASRVLNESVSIDDFTPESLHFLRDVKKQHDKADKEERKRLRKYAQRIYEYGEPLEVQRLKEYDDKVLNDGELFRPGTLNDYNMWFLDYLKQSGKITHYYDYSFNPSAWFVVNNTQKRVFLKTLRVSVSSSRRGVLLRIFINSMIAVKTHMCMVGRMEKLSFRVVISHGCRCTRTRLTNKFLRSPTVF